MAKRREYNAPLTFASIVVIAVFAFVMVILFSSITVTQSEEDFTVKCLYHTEVIAYDDVKSIELDYNYTSKRVFSLGGISKALGWYQNEELGKHYRISYEENKHNHIIVTKQDGSVVVFNMKTEPATAELYEKLREKIPTA